MESRFRSSKRSLLLLLFGPLVSLYSNLLFAVATAATLTLLTTGCQDQSVNFSREQESAMNTDGCNFWGVEHTEGQTFSGYSHSVSQDCTQEKISLRCEGGSIQPSKAGLQPFCVQDLCEGNVLSFISDPNAWGDPKFSWNTQMLFSSVLNRDPKVACSKFDPMTLPWKPINPSTSPSSTQARADIIDCLCTPRLQNCEENKAFDIGLGSCQPCPFGKGWMPPKNGSEASCIKCDLMVPPQRVVPQGSAVTGCGFGIEASVVGAGTLTCTPNPVPAGQTAICTAKNSTGSAFSKWRQCGGTPYSNTCTLTNVNADQKVIAEFRAVTNSPTYTLQVTKLGDATGTVNSSDGKIRCGSASGTGNCSTAYTSPPSPPLTLTVAEPGIYVNWDGCTQNPSKQNECSVTLNAQTPNAYVIATLSKSPFYRITTITDPPEAGTATCSPNSASSSQIVACNFGIVDSNKFQFTRWNFSNGNPPSACSTSTSATSCTFSPSESLTITGIANCKTPDTAFVLVPLVPNTSTIYGTNPFRTDADLVTLVRYLGGVAGSTYKVQWSDDVGIKNSFSSGWQNSVWAAASTIPSCGGTVSIIQTAEGERKLTISGMNEQTGQILPASVTSNPSGFGGTTIYSQDKVKFSQSVTLSIPESGTSTASALPYTLIEGNKYQLTGWSGNCVTTSVSKTCTLQSAAMDQEARARFSPFYTFELNKAGTGTGTLAIPEYANTSCGPTCTTTLTADVLGVHASLTITATPSEDSELASLFSDYEQPIPVAQNIYRIGKTHSNKITATFKWKPYQLNLIESLPPGQNSIGLVKVTASSAAVGTTGCNSPQCYSFDKGVQVTLTANDYQGYLGFVSWEGDCNNEPTNKCILAMDSSKNVKPIYQAVTTIGITFPVAKGRVQSLAPYEGKIDCNGEATGTSIKCSSDFPQNKSVSFTVTPSVGTQFFRWSAGPGVLTTSTEKTVTITNPEVLRNQNLAVDIRPIYIGAPDTSLRSQLPYVNLIFDDGDGKLLIVSGNTIQRFDFSTNSAGVLDTNFGNAGAVKLYSGTTNSATSAYVTSIVRYTSGTHIGKYLVGGQFDNVNGTSKNYIVRLNSNGTVDNTFNADSQVNKVVKNILLDPNSNTIYIAGNFDLGRGLARLNENGEKDSTFITNAGWIRQTYNLSLYFQSLEFVRPIAQSPQILVGMSYGNGESPTGRIIKINSDGSKAENFTADHQFDIITNLISLTGASTLGKILVGGNVRLHANGTFDSSYRGAGCAGNAALTSCPSSWALVDGDKVYTQLNTYSIPSVWIPNNRYPCLVLRLNAQDGSLDTTFSCSRALGSGVYYGLIRGGAISSMNGRSYLYIGGQSINYDFLSQSFNLVRIFLSGP